ncbi:histidine phosphatase family protein [Planctomicrobium sp. SH668]|uniref:histidine phosphatase family protein n=1 Tax=Planctomicrobium sp. SH668 TaxID=3448126 RepID=UPI003F5B1504
MSRQVVLVRHTAVCDSVRGICYGQTDVPLSEAGYRAIPEVVDRIVAIYRPTHLYESGLTRCRLLAEVLQNRLGLPAITDRRLQEKNYGDWEGLTWDTIYKTSGDAMLGAIEQPATWGPPQGETTFGLRDRVLEWYSELPETGCVLAVCHGGPIASLLGTLRNLPVAEWFQLIPQYGEIVVVSPSEPA